MGLERKLSAYIGLLPIFISLVYSLLPAGPRSEMDCAVFKSGVFLTKFGQKLLPFYLLSLIMCESVEKNC